MGKTKIKTVDDSVVAVEQPKKIHNVKPKKEEDSLVAKLNAELGIEKTSKSEVVQSTNSSENEDQEKKPNSHKKTQKHGQEKIRSKKYHEVSNELDRSLFYTLSEAVDKVKNLSYSKFNGTLEAHINTAQTGVRGLVSLPFASGKKLRILAFGLKDPESSGVTFGDDETISIIEKGQVNFDIIITTPDWMPKLAKVARVLGPKGLMPNPKNGTITTDLKKAIDNFQAGQTEYKTEAKAAVIHLALGKLNQPTEELTANVKVLLSTIGKSRIKKVSLSPTMGPSVKLDISKVI